MGFHVGVLLYQNTMRYCTVNRMTLDICILP